MTTRVKVNISKASDFRVFPATGAWGGVTSTGSIAVDFYIEKTEPHTTVELEVSEKGEATEVAHEPKDNGFKRLQREMQTGLVLSPSDAFSIGAWLMKNAVEAGYIPPSPPSREIQ